MRPATTVMLTVILAGAGAAAALDCFDYPGAFQPQGRVDVVHNAPAELAVVGSAAYSIGTGDAMVAVYDLSDLAHPHQVGTLPLPAAPRALAAGSAGLLVAVPGLGLVHYDLADLLAPVARDTLDLGADVVDVALSGDLAAVGLLGGTARMVTLAYPFGMIGLGSVSSPSGVTAVALAGNRLGVGTATVGVLIYDISDPSAPSGRGSVGFPSAVVKLDARDGLLVATGLAPGGGWLMDAYTIDDAPYLLATLSDTDAAAIAPTPRVTAADRVILSASAGGVREYRVDVAGFALTGLVPGDLVDAARDATRFVALSPDGLITGSDGVFPPAPIIAEGAGTVMMSRNGFIYSAQSEFIKIIDVSDPAAASVVGDLVFGSIHSDKRALALAGTVLYVGNALSSVEMFDVQDPTNPVAAGSFDVAGGASGLVVDGNALYVASPGGTLAIYDVTDPATPQILGALVADISVHPHMVKRGDTLLLSGPTYGIDVYDVSDPQAPVHAGVLSGRNYISALAIAGDRLLVTDRVLPVQVWRWNPTSRSWDLAGEVPFARTLDIAVAGDVGYVLHEFGNVAVLDLSGTGVPSITALHPTGDTTRASLLATGSWWSATDFAREFRIFPPACVEAPMAVEPGPVPAPAAATLNAAPNPFNPRTTFDFALPRAGHATLRVYDLRGQLVTTLIDGRLDAGPQQVDWNGTDAAGRPLPSGVYHARLTSAGVVASRAVSLLK